jgi:hypothetical protein
MTTFCRPTWFDHCVECALRRRRYAHSKFRMARLFRNPQMLSDGKSLLRDALEWLDAARR